MAQYGQVTQSHTIHGCAKLVFWLHTAGTKNPDTTKRIRVPPISMNTTQNTPDTPQTLPRQLQGAQHANRQQQTPTDTTRHTQTAPVSVFGCLVVSVGVCWHVMFPGDALGVSGAMSGWCLGASEWYSFKSEALGCVWGLSGFSVLAVLAV